MKAVIQLLVIAGVASTIIAVKQRAEINAVRAELEPMQTSPTAQPSEAASAPRAAVTPAAIAELRAETRDIHKLRGEIPRAREQRRVMEEMQRENAALREKIASIKENPELAARFEFPLANKGQATPEDAIETAFWSMYHADMGSLSRVMPMATAEADREPPAERAQYLKLLRAMAAAIEKLEIRELTYPAPEEAHLIVEVTPRANLNFELPFREQRFVLRRTNDVWQIVGQR